MEQERIYCNKKFYSWSMSTLWQKSKVEVLVKTFYDLFPLNFLDKLDAVS